jgi:hypothetical protein
MPIYDIRSRLLIEPCERWRPIAGHNLEVSDLGRIRDAQTKRICETPGPDKDGYVRFRLNGRKLFVHTLVLQAFVGPRPSHSHCCRHLNGDPADNRLENLVWGMHARFNLIGQRFGCLTVVSRGPNARYGQARWHCRCDCGGRTLSHTHGLKSGNIRFCSRHCKASPNWRPGVTRTREYISWRSMMSRCFNPNDNNYPEYGACGITVCERWRNSFEAFLADMGPRPQDKSIDRWPDNNGNYEPGNCRWATRVEQANNTRANIIIDIGGGVDGTLTDWCRILDLDVKTVRYRIQSGKFSPRDALFTPIEPKPEPYFRSVSAFQRSRQPSPAYDFQLQLQRRSIRLTQMQGCPSWLIADLDAEIARLRWQQHAVGQPSIFD